MKKKIVAFALCILMLGNTFVPVWAATENELKNQKKQIEDKIKEVKGQQTEVKQELSNEMTEISNLDASISDLDSQIASLNNQISNLESSIKDTEKKLKEKEDEHKKNQALMEERLVVMYESGETTFLDMLLNSKNIVEFISSYYMLSQINACDQELLATIEKEQEEIAQTKAKLENEKAQIASNKTEKEAKNNLLKVQKTQRQEKINKLSEEEKQLQTDIDSYNKKVDQIEADIKEALRKAAEDARRKAEEEARKKAEAEKNRNKNSSSSSTSTSTTTSTGTAGLKFDGSFIWPCNNKIVTSTVKQRWGRMHKGIDIGASYENVYASASGYAYNLENPGGYGHYIMIIHGDGYVTLYGHLNSYKISYGQYVKQGQVIAQSGNTGSSTGAHLHFEIRKASSMSNYFSASALNPLNYLPGGYTLASGA